MISTREGAVKFLEYLAKSAYKYSQPNHLELREKIGYLEEIHERLKNKNNDPDKLEQLDLKISALKLKLNKLSSRP